jgi:hypothetical protein
MLHLRFFGSPDVGRLTHRQRLLFVGLIALADDDGRGRADPYYLKGQLFPYDRRPSAAEIKNDLSVIAAHTKTVVWMHGDGNLYYALLSWRRFQSISRNVYKPSAFPAPPPDDCPPDSESLRKVFRDDSEHILTRGGKGRVMEMKEREDPSSLPSFHEGGSEPLPDPAESVIPFPPRSKERNPEQESSGEDVPGQSQSHAEAVAPAQETCPLRGDARSLVAGWLTQLGAERTDQNMAELTDSLARFCRNMQAQCSYARN